MSKMQFRGRAVCMSQTRLQKIETEVGEYHDEAAGIMGGNDNYDGADGARNVCRCAIFAAS